MDSPPAPDAPERRRPPWVLIAAGGAVAVLLGALVALGLGRGGDSDEPPPAAEGGLKIEMSRTEIDRLDPARPLRCFVGAQFVGDLPLADCAARNGVAAQALDVGLDASGALTAAVTPPPTVPVVEPDATPTPVVEPATPMPPGPVGSPVGQCLRSVGAEWRNLGDSLTLDTCVQILFAGRCVQPGEALYGRWDGQPVRLVPGRVEIASDGVAFRQLVEQDPRSCMIP